MISPVDFEIKYKKIYEKLDEIERKMTQKKNKTKKNKPKKK